MANPLDLGISSTPTIMPLFTMGNPQIAPVLNYTNPPQRVRFQLTNFVITIVDATAEYASAAMLTLPDKNLMIVNAEVNLSCVKGNATNGLGATDDISMGVGTAAASNLTLSTTMQNVIPVTAINTDALTVLFQASMFSAIGASKELYIPDDPANVLYLNVATSGGVMTADDTLTCTGTIDLWVVDLGNINS